MTTKRQSVILILGCLFALLLHLCLSADAQAHPHNWVDVTTRLHFDSNGRVIGIKQRWLFDDYYSVYITEDVEKSGDGTPTRQGLEKLRDSILGNLRKYRYFTLVEHGKRKVECQSISEPTVGMQKHRLQISFYLPFTQPIDPKETPLVYRVYDPTYYVEMVHAESDDAITFNNPPRSCRHRLEKPKPDPKMVAYAASLGIDENGDDNLGYLFAEKVTIQCP